jgi:hypothetical protein
MLGLLETAKGERLMELPTDPEKRRRFLELVTRPMREREFGLQLAKAAGDDFDEIIGALRHRGPVWVELCERVKARVVEYLEKAAEDEYLALVRMEALELMERSMKLTKTDGLTAAKAIACVESSMLDAALAGAAQH